MLPIQDLFRKEKNKVGGGQLWSQWKKYQLSGTGQHYLVIISKLLLFLDVRQSYWAPVASIYQKKSVALMWM